MLQKIIGFLLQESIHPTALVRSKQQQRSGRVLVGRRGLLLKVKVSELLWQRQRKTTLSLQNWVYVKPNTSMQTDSPVIFSVSSVAMDPSSNMRFCPLTELILFELFGVYNVRLKIQKRELSCIWRRQKKDNFFFICSPHNCVKAAFDLHFLFGTVTGLT